jgi:uncharacterized protein (TIGR02001 family)
VDSHHYRVYGAFIWLWLALASPAVADVTGSVAALSDYRFRGVSLSDNEPALQARIDWARTNGWSAGALASTVQLDAFGGGSGLILQPYAGYSAVLGRLDWSWSAGVVGYLFSDTGTRRPLDYVEAFARFGGEHVRLGFYLSNSYFGTGAASAYFDLSVSHPLSDRLTVFAHAGGLVTGAANYSYSNYGHTQQGDAKLGVIWDLRVVVAELNVTGAWSNRGVCTEASEPCAPGFVLAISRAF